MTNIEKVMSSAEDLAAFIASFMNCDECSHLQNCSKQCEREIIEWLLSEVEE